MFCSYQGTKKDTALLTLDKFYNDNKGNAFKSNIALILNSLLPAQETFKQTIVGLGFSMPYIESYHPNNMTSCLIPHHETSTPTNWAEKKIPYAIYDGLSLPLATNSVDYIIIAHHIELLEYLHQSPDRTMQEIWRVLKSTGQIIAIASNQTGIFPNPDSTPASTAKIYSLVDHIKLLKKNGFEVEYTNYTAFSYRLPSILFDPLSNLFEKIGHFLNQYSGGIYGALMGGAYVISARKNLYSCHFKSKPVKEIISNIAPKNKKATNPYKALSRK